MTWRRDHPWNLGRRRSRRRALLIGVLSGVLSGLAVAFAAPASAHAVLLSTTPAGGYSVPGPVEVVSLTFSEAVTATSDAVRIEGPTPGLRSLAHPTDRGRTLVVETGRLRDGVYSVHWLVTADDGDAVSGSYRFAVGVGVDPTRLRSPSRLDAVTVSFAATAVLRWVLFAALAAVLGGLAGRLLVRRVQAMASQGHMRPLPALWRVPLRLACLVGAVAAIVLAAHATNGSSFGSGLLALRPSQLSGGAAAVPLTEAVLFTATALLLSCPAPMRGAAALPALGVAIAEGMRGHLHQQDGVPGAALIAVHVAVAATWTGALLVVLATAARWRTAGRSNAAWQLVHSYSRAALVAYLLVVTTGTVAAVLLVPSWSSLTGTRYGVALLAKLSIVAIVTLLALRSRRLLRRTEGSTSSLRLSLLEPRALTATLAAAAVLVSFVPPRLLAQANAATPPSAPTGPVVQLGTLAGQLTVGVTVSAGQVRMQVSSPASDDDPSQENFAVTATLLSSSAVASPERLDVRPCGTGCFVAPANIAGPGVRLELTARARDWHGGQARFDVPWPPVPATAQLRQALALLAAARSVALRESVTSDTSRATPVAVTIHDSGPEFLASEPYGDAHAVSAVELSPAAGLRRLAFGVGDSIFVELTLDASGRLLAEQLVTPNHLILREFSYPVRH